MNSPSPHLGRVQQKPFELGLLPRFASESPLVIASKVLIAEDDPVARSVLQHALSRWGYEVIAVADGWGAWQRIERDPEICLLITDWMMPDMDGIELCRMVRSRDRERHLHVILLTSRNDKQDLLEGMQAGADAFLTKPLDLHELQAQLRVAERVLGLERALSDQLEDLRRVHRRLRDDLRSAGRLQRSLLPQKHVALCGIETAWIFEPCDDVAGDMLGICALDHEHLGFYVLDVSGHGVPAALLSVSLARNLTPFPLHNGILKREVPGTRAELIVPPAEVVAEVNRRFPSMDDFGQFVTLFYGVLHIPSRKLRYVRAGHPRPFLISRDGVRGLVGEGDIPLGILPEYEFQEEVVVLEPGEQLVVHTDGVDEARDARGELFGIDRLTGLLRAGSSLCIEAVLESICEGVRLHADGEIQHDDIAMVGLSLELAH